ncbi:hypothetical protein G3578_09765 [Brevibacillus sp. SYP-B805]|uniref:hypothetical protein n=1 Tax=Brevibacillus sp. SYP-B805 TaxID=1578199 RepID=UPI0013ECA2EF|nr:hypothetical protein [Brevibacillus sp. SYP-B805]NGQ95439.1 hypothetical protein [Brevibacillus sp. SYP-B805]
MTTKPPIICGRPYVLFDPEQTAEIKRVERRDDLRLRILNGINESLAAIDEYVAEFSSTPGLQNTIELAARKLLHVSGTVFYEDLDAYYEDDELKTVEWRGEVETI